VSPLAVAVVTAVASAVLGAVVAYLTSRRDLQLKFDASLRELRIGAYKELWKGLAPLAKYGRAEPLARSDAELLRNELRGWYFETGGIFLSTQTRQDYFTLLDALENVIAGREDILGDEDDEFLRVLGSRLRTAMTRDVGTRRTFVFRGDAEHDPLRLGTREYVDRHGSGRLVVTSKRRFALGHRPRLFPTLRSDEPVLRLPHEAQLVKWDAARRALLVRLAGDGRGPEERLFLLELDDGRIVEGPSGWRRDDTRPRAASTIWDETDDREPPTDGS
jgi:hypothetical protein